jgi:hypothetical protein
MQTKVTIYMPDGTEIERELDWPQDPGYQTIKAFMTECFGPGVDFEQVTVMAPGEDKVYTDMFVDEMGHPKGLGRNDKATEHYRRNYLTQNPKTNPDSMPYIVGVAVYFHRMVWY